MVRKYLKLHKQNLMLRKKYSLILAKTRIKRKNGVFAFSKSPNVSSRVRRLVREFSLDYIRDNRIFCVESTGSRSRSYARIWGLSRIWQETLRIPPAYILEVTHRFRKLGKGEQDKVLLHELAHIPKNFSGALLGHNGLEKRVKQMYKNAK